MASSQHPSFPIRPYPSSISGPSQQPPQSSTRGKPLGFSQSHAPAAREAARLERDRLDRERQQVAQKSTHAQSQAPSALSQLADEQRDEVNEAFALFDLDKDGLIDYHEFKVALKALGFDLPKPELLDLLTSHGIAPPSYQPPPGTSGQSVVPASRLHLTLNSFQQIASELILARDPRDEILRAFDLFDTEGKGMISLDDLRRVARELGEGLEEEELAAMIEEFDLEGKGGVGRDEFIGICMN
ncbi:hypothetical protein V493_04790 [Pseudogymnoascus sp. VKM F-4281 (FW-2241)]|nr:hypothetical protein V493_04790 [Pseudogymnoascus sp. VKM F-4281 (FW-2241)]